jgi:hypothetical protein
MDSAACILDAFWTDLAISTERTAVSDTAATAEANSLFILASVQIVVLQSCDRPLCADFVAEIGIPTARDGWCIFLKPSIVTRWIVRATYARPY